MSTSRGTVNGKDSFIANIASRLGREKPLAAPPDHPYKGVPEHYGAIKLSKEEKIDAFIANWTALSGKVLVVKAAEARAAIAAYAREVCAEWDVEQVARWEHESVDALGLDEELREAGVKVYPWRELEAGADGEAAAGGGTEAGGERAADSVQAGQPASRPGAGERSAEGAGAAEGAESNWAGRSPLLRTVEQCRMGVVWPDFAIANTSTLVLMARGGKGRSVSLLPDILFAVFRADQLVTRMGEALEQIRAMHPGGAGDLPSSVNLITGPSRSADIENDLTIGVHGPGKVYAVIID